MPLDGVAPRFSGAAWVVILLVVASALTGVILYTRRDVAFALVLVWALAGIAFKQSPEPLVSTTATVLAIVIAIGCIAALLFGRQGTGSTPASAPDWRRMYPRVYCWVARLCCELSQRWRV